MDLHSLNTGQGREVIELLGLESASESGPHSAHLADRVYYNATPVTITMMDNGRPRAATAAAAHAQK